VLVGEARLTSRRVPAGRAVASGTEDTSRRCACVILSRRVRGAAAVLRRAGFGSGAGHALHGHQAKIVVSIFLFTPSNVTINNFHNERDWMGTQQQPKDLFWRVR